MLIGARINPEDTPEANFRYQPRLVLISILDRYLCLLSEANLQQNCVLPDPGKP